MPSALRSGPVSASRIEFTHTVELLGAARATSLFESHFLALGSSSQMRFCSSSPSCRRGRGCWAGACPRRPRRHRPSRGPGRPPSRHASRRASRPRPRGRGDSRPERNARCGVYASVVPFAIGCSGDQRDCGSRSNHEQNAVSAPRARHGRQRVWAQRPRARIRRCESGLARRPRPPRSSNARRGPRQAKRGRRHSGRRRAPRPC